MFPLLIAQTPRAGRWNHVPLVPPGGPVAVAAAYLGAEADGRSGDNFVAAAAEVTQPTTGRSGREVLMLVGLAVPAGVEREALRAWLLARLPALGAAVAAFDWDGHSGGAAELPELAHWRDEAVAAFGLGPHPTHTAGPPEPGGAPLARVAAGPVLALAFVGFLLLAAGVARRWLW